MTWVCPASGAQACGGPARDSRHPARNVCPVIGAGLQGLSSPAAATPAGVPSCTT